MTTLNVSFVTNSSITDEKVRLRNNQPLRARNFSNNGDVSILKVDGSDLVYFLQQPKFSGTASLSDDLVNISTLTTTLGSYILSSEKGAANGVAPLNASSKIDTAYLPAIALTDVYVVANEAAQLALVAEEGDVAVRTDENKSYIHNGGITGTMADWQELLAPGAVVSVNGQTGTVSLDSDDISEAVTNLFFTDTRARSAQRYGIEVFTLNGTDISNGFVTLAQTPIAQSEVVSAGGLVQRRTSDYTFTGAQLNFAGDMSTYLASGDIIQVSYMY